MPRAATTSGTPGGVQRAPLHTLALGCISAAWEGLLGAVAPRGAQGLYNTLMPQLLQAQAAGDADAAYAFKQARSAWGWSAGWVEHGV
jgi:hypothetical protein